jgi:AGCS family alanine or glycine:cation symporter
VTSQLETLFKDLVVGTLDQIIFFDVVFWDDSISAPLVVLWLAFAALFFTLRFQFVNFRAFRHAIDCVRGRYTTDDAAGEISHFLYFSPLTTG